MNIRFGVATDPGQVRAGNEDDSTTTAPVFAVADGMGGHAAGEVASSIAVAALGRLAQFGDVAAEDVVDAIASANATILETAAKGVGRLGMGTTVAGVAVVRVGGAEHWAVFNVGDSRVYRYADGELAKVTIDHSEVEELVQAGFITAEDARTHPQRNVITRSLGSEPAPTPDLWVFPPRSGERFLICSDGLTNEVEEPTITDVLASVPDPQQAADRLVKLAVDGGGRDNVTVIVLESLDEVDATSVEVDTAPRPRGELN